MDIERVCANCNLADDEGYCGVLGYALGQSPWLRYQGGKVKPAALAGCALFEPSAEALALLRQDLAVQHALELADAACIRFDM